MDQEQADVEMSRGSAEAQDDVGEGDFALGAVTGSPIVLKKAPRSIQQIQREINKENHKNKRSRARGEHAEHKQMAQTLPMKGDSALHKWSQEDPNEGSERDDRSVEQDATTWHFPGFDKKMSTPLANVHEFGEEHRAHASAHKDYRAEAVPEFQQFELDDKSSKQTERASISLKKKQDHTQSGSVSPGEIYRPKFQQQRDVLAPPKRHQMSDTFNQDLKMHMNLHTTKAKKGNKMRLNNPSFLSRHSRRRGPRSGRGSQTSNRHDASNAEATSQRKSPREPQNKELENSPMANKEKHSPRSPGVQSSQQARDNWHSDHLEVYPVHNQSVYFSNKLKETAGTEMKDQWTGTEHKELADMVETMRKDSVHEGSYGMLNADGEQRRINQMYEVINSEVKIVNTKLSGDSAAPNKNKEGGEGTLLRSLKLKQMPFMESANSDLAEAGVPPVQLRAKGKINWNQLTEESQVELLKALQHIETFFPKTKAGFLQLQKILSVVEGIPGVSEHNSNSFSKQKSFMIEKMKRVEAEKKRNRLESAHLGSELPPESARQSSSSTSPNQRVISQTMNMYLEAITNQQKKMKTDPSKWMPHGQMLHPKMNYKNEEKNGQQSKADKSEAKKYLAPSNFKVTMQKRMLSQRVKKPQQITVIAAQETPEERRQLSDDEDPSRDRRSTIQRVRRGESSHADALRESEAVDGLHGSALTQNPIGSTDRTSSAQRDESPRLGMRVTGQFGRDGAPVPPAQPRELRPGQSEDQTEEKTWGDQEGFLEISRRFEENDWSVGASEWSGLHVHKIPGIQNEISVHELNAIKEEDQLTKAFQDGAMTVQKAVITPINLHELMMTRVEQGTSQQQRKPKQTKTPTEISPEEERPQPNSQMNHQLNHITKLSSSGAHVSSIQNIGMTSMNTQSRDAFGAHGPVTHAVPGSSETSHQANRATLEGRVPKIESDSVQLQGHKPNLARRPADVDISEQDLKANLKAIGLSKNAQSGKEFGSPSPSFLKEPNSSILFARLPGQASSPKMLNREGKILVKNQNSQSSGELTSGLAQVVRRKSDKGMENQTHITEAIHEESISQANTPNINPKATIETSQQVVQETISKNTSKTYDKSASLTSKTQPFVQQQYAAIKPVLQPIINIPQARRESSKNDLKLAKEPQVLNLAEEVHSHRVPKDKGDYDDGHLYRAQKMLNVPFGHLNKHVLGKELCKSGSVDHKAKDQHIRYFNEHRQMQMTPRQKKHLDYLAKKNEANNGSDYQERTPKRQVQAGRHGSSTLVAVSKSNKALNKFKGDNEDISQLLEENARTEDNKSKRSQKSYSPRVPTDGKSTQEQKKNETERGQTMKTNEETSLLHQDKHLNIKSEENSQNFSNRKPADSVDAKQVLEQVGAISTNSQSATMERNKLSGRQSSAIEAVIISGVLAAKESSQHRGSAEFGARSSGQKQEQAHSLTMANITLQDLHELKESARRGFAGSSYRASPIRVSQNNDPMNQTFGDQLGGRDALKDTNETFKFPLRNTEQKAQRLATQKRASLVEQLYIRNCNRENRFETFYQGRFKRADQHKAMVKLEQKRARKRLAAQNRDLQDHLKELLPPSREFSADWTETQSASLDAQPNNSVQNSNAQQMTPIPSSDMSSKMPPSNFEKHFGNRKKTMEAACQQKLTDGFKIPPPASQQMLGNISDKMQSSRTESMPPIAGRTYQSKNFHSSLPTQRAGAVPGKPEMSIVEHDVEHLKAFSTLLPNELDGRNEGLFFLRGQMNATSPTFSAIQKEQLPQENTKFTPNTPLTTGGNNGQIIQMHHIHEDNKRQSPHDESRRSRYDEFDSLGSQVEVHRESIIEDMNIEQSVTEYYGNASHSKGPARAPFMMADNVDPNELSHELEDIIMRKKFKENQEKYGLLPAVQNAQMNRTIHNEKDLFNLIGTDDIISSQETLNLKMQLKMLKNLNLKEKLHYQRLITNNTKNKNFNLTQNSPGNQWLRANMTATTGFGVDSNSLGLPSTKKKGKKDKMTFRLRKLSEINNEEMKAVAKPSFQDRRMSLYTSMPEQKPDEQFDLKSVDSRDERVQNSLLPSTRNAGFNKTVQYFNAGSNGQRPIMPFVDTISNTQSHVGHPVDAHGISNFAKLMNQSTYRAPFDPNRTQYSVTFQDVHKSKDSQDTTDDVVPRHHGLKQRSVGGNQRLPKILRQLSNQRGDIIGYVRNDKNIQTHRHMSVQPQDSTKIYGIPHKTRTQANRFNAKLCNQDLKNVLQVQKTMDKIGSYFGAKSLEKK